MNLSERIVEESRTWLGTPWRHNQRLRSVGVDCVQFAVGVLEACGAPKSGYENYYRTPQGNSLLEAIDSLSYSYPADKIEAGRILIFRIAGVPHHVAIATSETTMIHADLRVGEVVEHNIGAWKRKLAAIYEVRV
ncbi:hypothetical protein [Myxosarcina sp. GI1(2024)]